MSGFVGAESRFVRRDVTHDDHERSIGDDTFPAVARSHEDWSKLRLMSNITSGLAGTFFAELHGRRSLACTVFAGEFSNAEAGAFIAYLASEAKKEPEAREALLGEIRRLAKDGFGDEELARAKKYFAGSTTCASSPAGTSPATVSPGRS